MELQNFQQQQQQRYEERQHQHQQMPLSSYSPPTSNYDNYPLYAAMAAFRAPFGPPQMTNQQFVSSTNSSSSSNGYTEHYQFPQSVYNQALFHAQVRLLFFFVIKFVTKWRFKKLLKYIKVRIYRSS
jgi:hypothetical protein